MVRIITNKGERIDYFDDQLGIVLNRIVEENRDIQTRFGEFSYRMRLPSTKNNNRIFNNIKHKDTTNRFRINKTEVSVFLHSDLLFSAVLLFVGDNRQGYICNLVSKMSLFIDEIENKSLKDIQSIPDIEFDYEATIIDHVNQNMLSSDETDYQFPLMFYSTFKAPPNLVDGNTDVWGFDFFPNRALQNHYYLINGWEVEDNQIFYHQLPPALYLVTVIKAIFKDAGWSVSGSFLENENIKRIIIPFTGDNDVWEESLYCVGDEDLETGGYCDGNTPPYLRLVNFLPDIEQTSFIGAVMNFFNLFLDVDVINKEIVLESYNVLFTSRSNPIDITGIVDKDTVVNNKLENDDSNITLMDEVPKILMDNYYFNDVTENAYDLTKYTKTTTTPNFYDYVGDEKQDEIEIDFAKPFTKRMFLRQRQNYQGTITSNYDFTIFLPALTQQRMRDNNNMDFYDSETDTVVNNTPDDIRFDGLPTLMYYYGQSETSFLQHSGTGASSDWFYINFDGVKMKIPFASPYAYTLNQDRVNAVISDGDNLEMVGYASNMKALYLMLGTMTPDRQTDFSLVLSEGIDVFPTVYNVFHQAKYDRYKVKAAIEGTIFLDAHTYRQLKMGVPIKYGNQIYSLLAIENYDITQGTAIIKLIQF